MNVIFLYPSTCTRFKFYFIIIFLFSLLDVGERVCSRVSRSEAYPSEELLHDYTTSGMCFDAEDSKKVVLRQERPLFLLRIRSSLLYVRLFIQETFRCLLSMHLFSNNSL